MTYLRVPEDVSVSGSCVGFVEEMGFEDEEEECVKENGQREERMGPATGGQSLS